MTLPKIDFDGLNSRLSVNIRSLLPSWLPGGKIVGKEYMVASLLGGAGDSLRFNIEKCIGSDFATGDKFGDCIDLYAKVNSLTQIEAAKELLEQFPPNLSKPPAVKEPEPELLYRIPPDNNSPSFKHYKYGQASEVYKYKNEKGQTIFYMSRHETQTGKQFIPWSFMSDGKWHNKAFESPRPLFGLVEVIENPDLPCMVVEGEKSVLAAKKFAGEIYNVVTWSNGSQSFGKADWKPLYGKSILLWPDNDTAGFSAMQKVAEILSPHCPEIKIIKLDNSGFKSGWDAADSNFTWDQFKTWAKPRISVYQHNPKAELLPKTVNEPDEPLIDGSLYAIWDKLGVARTGNGQPVCNLDNALRVLEGFPLFTDILWFDEFHQKYYTIWNASKPREWSDIDDFRLTSFMQRELGLMRMSDDMINKAIRLHGKNHTRNEPRDWLNALKWDNEPRISTFFTNAAGAESNEYVTSASQNFWLTMVARILTPGCQVDNMIVFEGAQGKGKTSLLRTIGRDWYSSAKEKVDSNNFFLMLQGKLLIEIAELDSFNRAEITRIKQVVSDPVDRYRSPYDRNTEDHPRQSVFVGTTNEYAYLRDDTGGRRFWPVKCGGINLEYAAQNRDQLFAEAVSLFKNNTPWWIMPKSAADEQEQRRQIDPWEEKILAFIIQKFEVMTSEIMDECIKIESSKQSRFDEMRIGKILHTFNWKRVQRRRNGQVRYIYLSPNSENGKPSESLQ